MTKRKSTKTVESLRHQEASRKNIPTAEYQAVMAEDDRNPVRVAYERRNPDLDPQLVWRGKDEQSRSDLVVQAPPLFIQEKVHPKVLRPCHELTESLGSGSQSMMPHLMTHLFRHKALSTICGSGPGRRMTRPTCSPTSTGCRPGTRRRSSTSTTPTGRTG